MSERLRPDSKGELTFFQFVCPPERVEEVRELFEQEQLGSLSPETEQTTRVLVDPTTGEATYVGGVSIEGLASWDKQKVILGELADRKIAGYSRATQIIFPQTEVIGWGEQ